MKNLVPCKRCNIEFDYSPGFAGNARQYCNECRGKLDNEEVNEFIESMIQEENKLNQEKYDPTDILVDGNIPEFESNLERFLCTREVAFFVRKTGVTGLEDNLVKFFDSIELVHIIVFWKQQSLQTMEYMAKDKRFQTYVDRLMDAVGKPDKPPEPTLTRIDDGWECKPFVDKL